MSQQHQERVDGEDASARVFECPHCEFEDQREWLVRVHINLSDAGGHQNRDGFFKEDTVEVTTGEGEFIEALSGEPRNRFKTLHGLSVDDMPSALSRKERVVVLTLVQNLAESYSAVEVLANERLRDEGLGTVEYNKVYRTVIDALRVKRKSSDMSSGKQTFYEDLTDNQRAVINEYIRNPDQSMLSIAENAGVSQSYPSTVIEKYGHVAEDMTNADVIPVDGETTIQSEHEYDELTQLQQQVVDQLVDHPKKSSKRIAADIGCDEAYPDKVADKYENLIRIRRGDGDGSASEMTVGLGDNQYVVNGSVGERFESLSIKQQRVILELMTELNPRNPISVESIAREAGVNDELVDDVVREHGGVAVDMKTQAFPASKVSTPTGTASTATPVAQEPAEADEPASFADRFERAVEQDTLSSVSTETIVSNVGSIDDAELLRAAKQSDSRADAVTAYTERLDSLTPVQTTMSSSETQEQLTEEQSTMEAWADEQRSFEERFEAAVEAEKVAELNVQPIRRGINAIDDVELIRRANVQDDRKTSTGAFEERIDQLTASEEAVEQEEEEPATFEETFRTAVQDGDMKPVTVVEVRRNINSIDDVSLLEDALEIDDRKTSVGAIEERIEALTESGDASSDQVEAETPAEPDTAATEAVEATEQPPTPTEPEPAQEPVVSDSADVPVEAVEAIRDRAAMLVRTAESEIESSDETASAARAKSIAEEFERLLDDVVA